LGYIVLSFKLYITSLFTYTQTDDPLTLYTHCALNISFHNSKLHIHVL